MNEHDIEERLAKLSLARESKDFLLKGQRFVKEQINAQKTAPFWHRHLMQLLGTALTLSIAVNVVQLVVALDPNDSASGESQIAQCNTPLVNIPDSATPAFSHYTNLNVANNYGKPLPLGLC